MKHKPFVQEKQASHRPARFAQRLKEELVDIIPAELKDPRLFGLRLFTITEIKVADDLRNATAKFSLMGQRFSENRINEIEEALNECGGFIKRALMKRLATKVTPVVHFKYDNSFDLAHELDPLYKQIDDERKSKSEDKAKDSEE